MRYIDLSRLEVSSGWEARAEEALSRLRTEIAEAEARALESGEDVGAARKAAIRAGLAVRARERLWRELAPELKKLGYGKCWYSESRNTMSDDNVDHFRPKARVDGDGLHEGYWWLAFDWKNLRYASEWCNQRRHDRVNDTSGGKGDQFPLQPGSGRAYSETDDCDLEDVELLDPVDPEDWRLLTFDANGYATASRPEGTAEHRRARTSISVYHLHRWELVRERKALVGRVGRIVDEMELLRVDIGRGGRWRRLYKERLKELLGLFEKRSTYSAAALAYARAGVYKLKSGQEVRRKWLEDILNGNP